MNDPAAPADPTRSVPVPVYALAHFGKSLWWNGSELLLAFYLTEGLALHGVVAGMAIAAGLLLGAMADIIVADRRRWFASVPRAGRMQFLGASGSLVALAILVAATGTTDTMRLFMVVAANLVYRLAYVFYDLPQNCLLGLVEWSGNQRRTAASWRTAAGAMALVLVSFASGTIMHEAIWSMVLVASGASVALISAWWLWRIARKSPDIARDCRRTGHAAIGKPLAIMAAVCLTVPAFSKLAPYLATYAPVVASAPLLLVIGCCSAVSQPAWLTLTRRFGEGRAMGLAGLLLVIGSLTATTGAMTIAAAFIGIASGGLGTGIWSMFAASLAGADPLDVAPAFARLTATAKIALAFAAVGIGALLGSTDYRGDGARLLPAMTLLTFIGGIAVLCLSCGNLILKRERHAGSA